jgi:hypothetical protein
MDIVIADHSRWDTCDHGPTGGRTAPFSPIARCRRVVSRTANQNIARGALVATEFFHIPPNRVIELGGQVEI